MKGARGISPFGVRFPENIKSWLRQQSEEKGISMNSELVRIVREAMKEESKSKAEC